MSWDDLMGWWHAYHAEPWGDARADLRDMAGIAVGSGQRDWEMTWPYYQPETAEEVAAEFEEINRQWENQYGERNRGDNPSST